MDQGNLADRLKSKQEMNRILSEAMENAALLRSLFELALTETSGVKYMCTKCP